MPLQAPLLDRRSYQDLVDEALARIPVHNPQWTNFNPADPGVTLIEVFAFLTESLLYRANQIPERNRLRFLQLLGVPMLEGAAARAIVAIDKEQGPLQVETVASGLEMFAGDVAFRSEQALDVLPVEGRLFCKRPLPDPDGALTRRYEQLYASYYQQSPGEGVTLKLYQTQALDGSDPRGLAPGEDTVDGCLWLALCARPVDANAEPDMAKLRQRVRELLAGKTLSLGVVPSVQQGQRELSAAGSAPSAAQPQLRFALPDLSATADALGTPADAWRSLESRTRSDVLVAPGTIELPLPDATQLRNWETLDPLEQGAGQFPPALDDEALQQRVITWLRIRVEPASPSRLLWLGINAVMATQRERIVGEALAAGSGESDQSRTLARPPLVPGSLRLTVSAANGSDEQTWQPVDDLLGAGPEVPLVDPRQPPGSAAPIITTAARAEAYTIDHESGLVRFGDGFRGRRPPEGARIRASYDHSRGAAGNVGAGAINTAPALATGCMLANPVRAWGGMAAEAQDDAERRVPRFLQHRDRLVSHADFETLARQTPGVDLGRVEVQSAFHPDLEPDAPGNAPGVVTLMLIPRSDPLHPDSPEPDRLFVNAVCDHLAPRRLVTTELVLRGPRYVPLWLTVGIEVIDDGRSTAEVREDVRSKLRDFLSPLQAGDFAAWPLRKEVAALELAAVASRVAGVRLVHGVRLLAEGGSETTTLALRGLQLPRVAGIAVQIGEAADPADLRSGVAAPTAPGEAVTRIVPVPVVPQEC